MYAIRSYYARLRREERESGGGYDAEAIEKRLYELARLKRKLLGDNAVQLYRL